MTKINKDVLKANLQNGIGTIVFTKADGTERTMKCTLQADKLPVVEIKEGTKAKVENPEILSVWDLENSGWRSFRLDSIISAEVTA